MKRARSGGFIETYDTPAVGKNGWIPLEVCETYLVYGSTWYTSKSYAAWNETANPHTLNGVYCLSAPTKRAGGQIDDEIYEDSLAYIHKNYDLSKHGPK